MNKLTKIIIAVFGAVNAVFGMFIPIAVALLSVSFFGFRPYWGYVLLVGAIMTSLYRAFSIGFIKK